MYIKGPNLSFGAGGLRVTDYRNTLFRQSRIPRKAKRAAGEDANPPGYLCWGSTGSLPSGEAVATVGFQVVDEKHTEISRETTPVRIENPDDPEQYVDALQTNKMKLEKTEPSTKNNSDTKDADLAKLKDAARDAMRNATELLKRGNYTVIYKPPARAL